MKFPKIERMIQNPKPKKQQQNSNYKSSTDPPHMRIYMYVCIATKFDGACLLAELEY